MIKCSSCACRRESNYKYTSTQLLPWFSVSLLPVHPQLIRLFMALVAVAAKIWLHRQRISVPINLHLILLKPTNSLDATMTSGHQTGKQTRRHLVVWDWPVRLMVFICLSFTCLQVFSIGCQRCRTYIGTGDDNVVVAGHSSLSQSAGGVSQRCGWCWCGCDRLHQKRWRGLWMTLSTSFAHCHRVWHAPTLCSLTDSIAVLFTSFWTDLINNVAVATDDMMQSGQ